PRFSAHRALGAVVLAGLGAVLHYHLPVEPRGRAGGRTLGLDRGTALRHHPAAVAAADALAGRRGTGALRDARAPGSVAGGGRDRLRAVLLLPRLRGLQRALVAGGGLVPAHRGGGDAAVPAALPRPPSPHPARRLRHRAGGAGRGGRDA